MSAEKSDIAKLVNKCCWRASCYLCENADEYGHYSDCPLFSLKQLRRERRVTADDIPDSVVQRICGR